MNISLPVSPLKHLQACSSDYCIPTKYVTKLVSLPQHSKRKNSKIKSIERQISTHKRANLCFMLYNCYSLRLILASCLRLRIIVNLVGYFYRSLSDALSLNGSLFLPVSHSTDTRNVLHFSNLLQTSTVLTLLPNFIFNLLQR